MTIRLAGTCLAMCGYREKIRIKYNKKGRTFWENGSRFMTVLLFRVSGHFMGESCFSETMTTGQ